MHTTNDLEEVPSNPPSGSSSSISITSQRNPFLLETSTKPILTWRNHTFTTTITTPQELCQKLDTEANTTGQRYRCSRIKIPRGNSRVEVKVRDTFEEPEKERYSHYFNQDSSIANIGLPRSVWWRRVLFGEFKELVIISPESSPGSSPGGSSHEVCGRD